jgi:hypothetical protein
MRELCGFSRVRRAYALHQGLPMRSLVVMALLAGCASRQHAWTTLDAPDLTDGEQAFVLVDNTALHIANVQHVDDRLQGRVLHAWALPTAGVAALADDTMTTSPEQIARRAGWPELPYRQARLDVPVTSVRSARGIVDIEPDPVESPSAGESVAAAMVTTLMETMLVEHGSCHCHHRCRD